MTPDNLPLVGRLDERTLVAAGHGRSGFLLAPWTAEAHRGRTARAGNGWAPMKLTVNDEAGRGRRTDTVAALLDRLGYPEKGIAVAVDWSVIPRSEWDTDADRRRAKVDVVTAVQGG